jgi:hypothetical protein
MAGPTEDFPPFCLLQAPIKVLSNTIPVEVMARVAIEELSTVPFEALSNAKPIVVLAIGPSHPLTCPIDSTGPELRGASGSQLRALAPVWPMLSGDPSPIPSASPLKIGPNSLLAFSPSPLVEYDWPSAGPRTGPSALPSSLELNFGYMPGVGLTPMVAPAGACLSTAPRPRPGANPTPLVAPAGAPRSSPVPSTVPLNLGLHGSPGRTPLP